MIVGREAPACLATIEGGAAAQRAEETAGRQRLRRPQIICAFRQDVGCSGDQLSVVEVHNGQKIARHRRTSEFPSLQRSNPLPLSQS